jgi:hypothetical protein
VEHELFVWLLDDALRFLEQNQQPLADSAKISLLLETARSRLHIVAAYPWPDSDRLIDNEDGTVSRGGYREFWTRRDSVLETFANLNDNLEAIASILDQSNELDDSIRVELTSQLAEIESALARTIADQPNIFGAGSLSTH